MNRIKFTLLSLGVITTLIGYGVVAWKAFNVGKTMKSAERAVAEQKDTSEKLSIIEKQNEIRNAPINNDITDRRLLAGTF